MTNEIFLDTSFSIALTVERDRLHQNALRLARELWSGATEIITTQAVVLEIGNALSKLKYRRTAVEIIEQFNRDPNVIIVSLTDELFDKAFALFSSRPDKEWGLIDCVSFIVMRQRNIIAALTADEHFVQAGFRALLAE